MQWISNAPMGADPKDGTIFELKGSPLIVKIHKYAGCGDLLFLSCSALGITTSELHTSDFDEAVLKAQQRIAKKLEELRTGLAPFTEADNAENEFIRY